MVHFMKANILIISSALSLFLVIVLLTPIDSSLSHMSHKINDHNRSYFLSHEAYAAATTNTKSSGTKSFTVIIPKGSANPEIDITKLGPRQWYLPSHISIGVNNTVKWINNDTEAHTVTSGIGSGIESLQNNKRGTPNGIFDSGLFKPGQSWTHIFMTPGTYNYFCTIHPWMEAVVTVQGKAQNIPNYPVYASGAKITSFPIYQFTPDGKTEVGLSWNPQVLLTGKETSFVVIFFDRANNKPSFLPFDFVITQGGKQLQRIPSVAQIGMSILHYTFPNSGPVTIGIENVGAVKSQNVEVNTRVFDNPSITSAAANQLAAVANKQSSNPFAVSYLTLVYIEYAVIFGLPAAAGIIFFVAYKYRKPYKYRKNKSI
jgi:plastocyanin